MNEALKQLKPRRSKFIPDYIKPTPKQTAFMIPPHREALYGGAAGSGKSIVLSYMALQYADVVGYNGIIFRRTLTEANLAGSVMDILIEWLSPRMGRGGDVKFDGSYNTFYFLEYGSQLTIAYLKNEIDHERYKGTSFHFCVEKNTPVLLETGMYKPIKDLIIGDIVKTLEGPKPVTYVSEPKTKFCVKVGNQIQGWDHRLYTNNTWSSYETFLSTLLNASHNISLQNQHKFQSLLQTPENQLTNSLQPYELNGQQSFDSSYLREFYAWLKDDRTDYGEFGDLRQVTSQLPKWNAPLELFSPENQKAYKAYDDVNDLSESLVSNYETNYGVELHPYDEHARQIYSSNTSLYYPPLPTDVDKHIHGQMLQDVQDIFPKHNHSLLHSYVHPYTNQLRWTAHTNASSQEIIEPYGFSEVVDIRVADASHYITDGKFINSNCGFDELTDFSENQYRFLNRSLRRSLHGPSANIPLRIRCATNPGGLGHVWVKSRFRIQKCTECCGRDNAWRGHHADRPFVQATLKDNPHIDQSAYTMALNEMGEIDRLRMKDGDWDVSAGARFKDEWFTNRWDIRGAYFYVPQIDRRWHRSGCEIFITMDVAASTRDGVANTNFRVNQERSYTVMSVWAKTPDNYLLWLDQVRIQAEVPDILQKLIQVARSHKPSKIIVDAQGIGKGVAQMAEFLGLPVDAVPTVSDKIQNSVTAQTRAKKGKIILPAFSPWLDILTGELFTWTGHPHETDDQIDALSNAALYVQQQVSFGEREYDTQPAMLPTTKGEGWSNGYVGNSYPDTPFFSGEESYNPFGN